MRDAQGPGAGPKRAVLIGTGHAHLHALKRAAAFRSRGFELVAVAPEPFWYSGLATGMLGGMYRPEEDQIDVAALAARSGARFVLDRAVGVDLEARRVLLESGPPLDFAALSLNLGSVVPVERVPGLAEHAVPVKPIRNLWHLRRDLEERLASSTPRLPVRVLVVGAGPTGCEVAANIRRLAEHQGGWAEITLISSGERILRDLPPEVSHPFQHWLAAQGVGVVTHCRIERVEPGQVVTPGGRRLPFDVLVAAIGLAPPPLVGQLGLPTDPSGALRVDGHLRSIADPAVHGGGDCVTLEGFDLPRLGVHAVYQAPVLYHNLLATLEGRPPRRYQPWRPHLWIMNLGDGTGLAIWGKWHWRGKMAFWFKDWLDRRFLRTYA